MNLAAGLYSQWEVVHALVLRETRTRFGQHKLGYVWALVEPALMILTFYVLFALAGRDAPSGMDLFGFLATGLVPYMLFSSTVNQVANSINGNKPLLFYPHVQVLDLAIARVLLEMVTHAAMFMVLLGIRSLYLQEFHIDELLLVLIGFAVATGLGAGLGLVFCTLAQFSNVVDRARGPIMRPFFWVSGLFFTLNSLPKGARDLAAWNPVIHPVELVRDGWYVEYRAEYVDVGYALIWVVGLLFVGLTLERVIRRRIEVT